MKRLLMVLALSVVGCAEATTDPLTDGAGGMDGNPGVGGSMTPDQDPLPVCDQSVSPIVLPEVCPEGPRHNAYGALCSNICNRANGQLAYGCRYFSYDRWIACLGGSDCQECLPGAN